MRARKLHHPQDGLERESSTIQEHKGPKKGTCFENNVDLPKWANWARSGPRICGCFLELETRNPKQTFQIGREKATTQKEEGEPRLTLPCLTLERRRQESLS